MAKDLNPVVVSLTLAGKTCLPGKIILTQAFNKHHTFEAVVDYEEFESVWMENQFVLFGMIGKDATIQFNHRDGSGENVFCGIITDIEYKGEDGEKNWIVFHGASPTIRMEGKKTMDSFMDKTLTAIVTEAVGNSGNGARVTPNPKHKGTIDYICQYDESCFEFLNRLSSIYGEWFFYDGKNCYFGNPMNAQSDQVTYDLQMPKISFKGSLRPSLVKRYHYFHHLDYEIVEKASNPSGVVGYHTISVRESDSVYTGEALSPMPAIVQGIDEMEKVVEREKERDLSPLLTLSGESQTSRIGIGKKVTFELPKTMRTEMKHLGVFLITEVTHTYVQKGTYTNEFTAISAPIDNIPVPEVKEPKAFPQLAWVKSNADDEIKGRVKVQFQWQKLLGKTTNWIRVKTPDAGESELVPKNRGFVFIPEEGDIVMIDFEYGDPNRPYVSGSIFSELVSEGGKENNRYKTIITRSGITIQFDDDENQGSLLIKDPSGNFIKMDGNKNITITAPATLTMNATDINVNATNSINVRSAPDEDGGEGTIDVLAHQTYTLQTERGNISVQASEKNIALEAHEQFSATSQTASMNLQAAKNTNMDATDIQIKASSTIRISSSDTDII